jgi:exosome complex component RRP4
MTVMFEKRQLVTPGDLLAEGDYVAGENTYKENNKVRSQKLGLADLDGKTVYVVALKGRYLPKVGDLVIGQVVDVSLSGWTVDINAPYYANLSVSEVIGKSFSPRIEALTSILNIGEIVIGAVAVFDRTRNPILTVQGHDFGRVDKGIIIDLTPTKIPRLIGRKGSMINMLKQESGCEIIVGQNGKILIRGGTPKQTELIIKAVKMIEEEAHTTGLTDRIKAFIEKEKGGLKSGSS